MVVKVLVSNIKPGGSNVLGKHLEAIKYRGVTGLIADDDFWRIERAELPV